MIASQDRSYYIGGSDVEKVIGNWKTKTWFNWWMQKIAINKTSVSPHSANNGFKALPEREKDQDIKLDSPKK